MKCPKCQVENPDGTNFCSKCGTELFPPNGAVVSKTETLILPKEDLTIGSDFGQRYKIIEELGKGGMGAVYKVLDNEINQVIALKVLNPHISGDEKMMERFRNELILSRKITHKNVCRMFDIGKIDKTLYITMEFVKGEDLKSFIRRIGQLPVGKTISIAKQICEGLKEAHHLGVVHRDLKPQNIMIDKDGNALIMDFGIARSVEADGFTENGAMIGTPSYISPEQVDGKKADQRSDLYALGIILYEMVTGTTPFTGTTPISIALKHKTEAPPNPLDLNAQVPEGLNQIISRCLEKDRHQRYQNAEEVLTDLENADLGLPTAERTAPSKLPSLPHEVTVQSSKKKRFIPIFIFAAAAALSLVVWLVFFKKAPPAAGLSGSHSIAVLYFENNTGEQSLDHWKKALADLLIADLSQSKYFQVLSGDKLYNILSQMGEVDTQSYSSDVLKQVAEKARVDHILRGSYAKANEDFRVITELQNAQTGNVFGTEQVQGTGEESFFFLVDELTRKIKENFKLSKDEIETDIDKEVGKITTNSPEAYRSFEEAIRYGNEGDYDLSISFLERAIKIDPEFATAYRSLAVAYGNQGYKSKEKENIQKALEFTDRISDKERYEIEGYFYGHSEKTYEKAIEAYTQLLQLYPENRIANTNLGLLYSVVEEWDKAINRLEKNRINRVETFPSYVNLSLPYMAKGDYGSAREVLEYYLNNFSDHPIVHNFLAVVYLCQNKFGLAMDEADKAIELDPNLYINLSRKGDVFLCKGDLIKAGEEYQKLLDSSEQIANLFGRDRMGALYMLKGQVGRANSQLKLGLELAENVGEMEKKTEFHLQLAYNHLLLGNYKDASDACDKAWRIGIEEERLEWQLLSLYRKGDIYLQMEAIEDAQRTADELMGLIPRGINGKKARYYNLLMGKIEFKKKNLTSAINYFEKALSMLHSQHWPGVDKHTLFIAPLAQAAFETGDLEKAQQEYEKLISLTTGRIYNGDFFVKSHYKLGQIFQKKGLNEKAAEYYEKFLGLWNEADAIFPEIADARKQLDILKND